MTNQKKNYKRIDSFEYQFRKYKSQVMVKFSSHIYFETLIEVHNINIMLMLVGLRLNNVPFNNFFALQLLVHTLFHKYIFSILITDISVQHIKQSSTSVENKLGHFHFI